MGYKEDKRKLIRMKQDFERKNLSNSALKGISGALDNIRSERKGLKDKKGKKILSNAEKILKKEIKKEKETYAYESGMLKLSRKEEDIKRKRKREIEKGFYKAVLPKKKILGKPKVRVKKLSAVRAIAQGTGNYKMVTPGEEGFFKKEIDKERKGFLGGYSL